MLGTPLAAIWGKLQTRRSSAAIARRGVARARCLVVTLQLRESSNTAAPCAAFPCASFSDNSHTACHEPTSDQPHETGTTAAREVFSMTA